MTEKSIKSFKELFEMSIAKEGDFKDAQDALGIQGEFGMKKFQEIETFSVNNQELKLFKLRNSLYFKLGYWTIDKFISKIGEEERNIFVEVFHIELSRVKSLEHLGYSKVVNVDGVATLDKFTNKGIATIVYKYLVNTLNYTVLGDKNQYFGARKLWARLSNELDVGVDLVDIKDMKVIQKNVTLHHGKYDSDFDSRLWDYSEDKKNIRCILTKIG